MAVKHIPGENGEPDKWIASGQVKAVMMIQLPPLPPKEDRLSIRFDHVHDLVVPYEFQDDTGAQTQQFMAMMHHWATSIYNMANWLNPAIRPGVFTVNMCTELGELLGTLSASFDTSAFPTE